MAKPEALQGEKEMAIKLSGPNGFNCKRSYLVQTAAITRGFAVSQGTDDNQVILATAASKVIGIADETQAVVGAPISIITFGEAIAIAGAAFNAGDELKSDGNGNLIAGNAADVESAGRAVNGAAALNDEFVIFVSPKQKRS
jgi:hypothetical protein